MAKATFSNQPTKEFSDFAHITPPPPMPNQPITENGITDDFGTRGSPLLSNIVTWDGNNPNGPVPDVVKQFRETLKPVSDSEFAGGGKLNDDPEPQAQVGPVTQLKAGPGTGFVNIDKYLGANTGVAKNVNALRDKALIGNANAFESSIGKLRGTSSNIDVVPQLSQNLLNNGYDALSGANVYDSLKDYYLPNKSQGTTESDQMSTGSSDTLSALANSKTTGREIARQRGITGQYAPQLSAIDSAIYGQGAGGRAVGNVQQAIKTQSESQEKTKSGLESGVRSALDRQQRTIENNKNVARGFAQQLMSNPASSKPGSPENLRLKMISDALGESYQPIAPATSIAPASTAPAPQPTQAPMAAPVKAKSSTAEFGSVPGTTYETDYKPSGSSNLNKTSNLDNTYFDERGAIRTKTKAQIDAEQSLQRLFDAISGKSSSSKTTKPREREGRG